jgi:predicted ATPase/class 3 adenylate cyclase
MTTTPARPSGTVTFLFTDIEGAAHLWEAHPAAMEQAHARHTEILRQAIEAHGGYAYKMVGDAFQAAFPTAVQALQAALDAQLALRREPWAETGELRVRMSLHTGVTEEREGDYSGPLLNRAHRLMSAAHGGQTLVSQATQQLLRDLLPAGAGLLDLGEHRLRDLTRPEHVFQLVHPELPSWFPPLDTLERHPNNLPVQPNPFIGREQEVEAVVTMLRREDVALLTLTGPGGIGKTRLALQAAAEMVDDFEGGVFFAGLAPLVDPGLVVPTTAYALGLREGGDQPIEKTLKQYLADKRLLLVLDNFEHVIEAGPAVAELLERAPNLKVLVTSRASLRLSMEHEYAVPLLPVPDPARLPPLETLAEYDAVALFTQRAQAVKPDFEVNTRNAAAVAEICYRLEGIPLAIELAAARIKVLPPQALLDRLESRLKLLTGGSRDLHTRHQTLRNTIEWSYDLLTGEEKRLFRRASVFRGGATLEALEEVCEGRNTEGTMDDGRWTMEVNKHPLPADEADGSTANGQPSSIDERGALRAANYRPSSIVHGLSSANVLDGITSLVAKSLMYTVEGVEGEARYWTLETISEYAAEKLEESGEGEEMRRWHGLYFVALAEAAEPELRSARQREWLARLEDDHDNLRAALRWSEESGSPEAIEAGLRLAGALTRFWQVRGYLSEGREHLASALAAYDGARTVSGKLDHERLLAGPSPHSSSGDNVSAPPSSIDERGALRAANYRPSSIATARALHGAGVLAHAQGDYDTARALYRQGLTLRREIDDTPGVASSLNNLGVVAQETGDYAAARALHEESLALKRDLGDSSGIAFSLTNLGNVAKEQADYAAARAMHAEALALFRQLGDKRSIASALTNLGVVAFAQGDHISAHSLHSEALALFRELGDKRSTAIALNNLGSVACEQGDYTSSRVLYEECLDLCREVGDKVGIASVLAGLGRLAVASGGANVERGVRLFGSVEALSETLGAVLDAADHLLHQRAIAAARAQLGEETFKKAWNEGRAMTIEEAIEYALAANPA